MTKRISEEEIDRLVPNLAELNGAGRNLDRIAERERLTDLVYKAAQVIDEIDDAAVILEVPKLWITKYNMTAWNKGKAIQRANISRSQVVSALKGSAVSQIWTGKQRLGQSDRPAQDKYINRRYNTGSDLKEAQAKLDKVFGEPPKPKRKHKDDKPSA